MNDALWGEGDKEIRYFGLVNEFESVLASSHLITIGSGEIAGKICGHSIHLFATRLGFRRKQKNASRRGS